MEMWLACGYPQLKAKGGHLEHTEFLLDDLEDLLLVKLLGKTLDRSQGLTSIALCNSER